MQDIRIYETRINITKDGVLRFRLAYLRDVYKDYNIDAGDALDKKIESYFPNTGLIYAGIFTNKASVAHHLSGFTPSKLPLNINPDLNLSGLTDFQIENISKQPFPFQDREITLYRRVGVDEKHRNFELLPTEIVITLDSKIYEFLSETIHPF